MLGDQITRDQFKSACLVSNGPGELIRNLGLHDNGTWRKKIKELGKEYGIEIPKYDFTKYEPESKKCPVCGKVFEVKKDHPRAKKVCSRACSNTYFRSGENNPNYKKGFEGHNAYRRICFEHHEKKCCICGFDLIVEVHHMDCNCKNNNPSNLVPLCPNHHRMFHSRHKNLILPLIEEYLKSTGV